MPSISNEHLKRAVENFANLHILVIGDLIVDHFIWGSVSRISPEAPVPVVNVTNDNLLLGGSANVLHNLYAMGAKATICGVTGNDAMGDRLKGLIGELPSSLDGVFVVKDRPTTIKTRIVAQGQQIVRFDREHTGEVSGEYLKAIKSFIDQHLTSYDAVIVSDYAKGIINNNLMDHLRTKLQEHPEIPLVIDPKPVQPERFKGATIITPNHHEAEKISGISITDEDSLLAAGNKLLETLESKAVLITRGEAGMSIFEHGKAMITIPTVAKEVFDVTGAGDTVIATLALGLAAGLSFGDSAHLANLAAGIVVGKVGTATTTKNDLLEVIQ